MIWIDYQVPCDKGEDVGFGWHSLSQPVTRRTVMDEQT